MMLEGMWGDCTSLYLHTEHVSASFFWPSSTEGVGGGGWLLLSPGAGTTRWAEVPGGPRVF